MEAKNFEKLQQLEKGITDLVVSIPKTFSELLMDEESTLEERDDACRKLMECADCLISAGLKLTIPVPQKS